MPHADTVLTQCLTEADTPSGDHQHAETQGIALGVTPEGSLLTVVIHSLHAAQGTRQAGHAAETEQGHQDAPGRQ